MRILVQKFGGTSVADIDRLNMVREKVMAALDRGYKVVVVLSARAGKTNKLLAQAARWADEPDPAEVDALLSTGEQGPFRAGLADPHYHGRRLWLSAHPLH